MAAKHFDVFLCHSAQDKPSVEFIADYLLKKGVRPWLDKWNLIRGDPWQEGIEEALCSCAACAVFLGPAGIGPVQNEEMRVALERRLKRGKPGFRVIPVLLPGAKKDNGRFPALLTRATWVEFGHSLDDTSSLNRLISGIKGVAPGKTGVRGAATRWVIVLEGIYSDLDKPRAEAVARHLRGILGDSHLTITRIESGSVVIHLSGSAKSFQRLRSVFKSGKLRRIGGLRVLEVREESGTDLGEKKARVHKRKSATLHTGSREKDALNWFAAAKRHGAFIQSKRGEDTFVDPSPIREDDFAGLEEDQTDKFVHFGPKGFQAANVKIEGGTDNTDMKREELSPQKPNRRSFHRPAKLDSPERRR